MSGRETQDTHQLASDPTGPAAARLGRFARALEKRIARLPVVVIGIACGLIALLKSGIGPRDQIVTWSLDSWPEPSQGYPHTSYGLRLVAYALRIESLDGILAIAAAMTVVTLVASAWLIHRAVHGSAGRLAAIILMSGPPIWLLGSMLGRADVFNILGAFMLGALGRRVRWALAATVPLILGNPELGAVAAAIVALASLTPALREWRRGAFTATAVTVAAAFVLSAYGASAGVETRAGALVIWWRTSAANFLSALPLELYAAFGLSLIVVTWALVASNTVRSAIWLGLVAIGIPLAVTAVTLDQTRVAVGCSTAVVVAIVVSHAGQLTTWAQQRRLPLLALAAIAAVAAPAVEVSGRAIRVPWIEVMPFLQAYVIDRLLLT